GCALLVAGAPYLRRSLSQAGAFFLLMCPGGLRDLHSFPTRRSSDLVLHRRACRPYSAAGGAVWQVRAAHEDRRRDRQTPSWPTRSEEHTSELQSRENLVCRLLLEKKNRRAAGSACRSSREAGQPTGR